MRPDDIRRMLRRQPFEPFRLCLLDGTVYDIRHPDQILVERSVLVIGAAATNLPVALAEREVLIALLHVSRLEPLGRPQRVPLDRCHFPANRTRSGSFCQGYLSDACTSSVPPVAPALRGGATVFRRFGPSRQAQLLPDPAQRRTELRPRGSQGCRSGSRARSRTGTRTGRPHRGSASPRRERPGRGGLCGDLWIFAARGIINVPVRAPLVDVAVHVVQPESICRVRTHRRRPFQVFSLGCFTVREITIKIRLLGGQRIAKVKRRCPPGTTGVFPLRLRR